MDGGYGWGLGLEAVCLSVPRISLLVSAISAVGYKYYGATCGLQLGATDYDGSIGSLSEPRLYSAVDGVRSGPNVSPSRTDQIRSLFHDLELFQRLIDP